MAEKRWVKRKRKRISLRYGSDAPEKMAFTYDVSHDGLLICSAVVVNPGTRLKVELTLPAGRVLLEGEVRWAKKVPPQMMHLVKGGMGLKILAITEGAELYRQLCDDLYSRSY